VAQFPPAVRRGRLLPGPVRLGLVPCRHSGAGSGYALVHHPDRKALFFPIGITYLNDYPCPDPNFQPPPGQTLEEFLTEGAAAIIDLVTELEVIVDGQHLNDLFSYRAISRLFTFTSRSIPCSFDSCVTGTEQYGVTDGYWILLRPLPPGPHTIFLHAVIDFGGGNTF